VVHGRLVIVTAQIV